MSSHPTPICRRSTTDDERRALHAALPGAALAFARELAEAGVKAWFVGGCVRDALLGRPIHDVDLASATRPDEMLALCRERGWTCFEAGKAFGTVGVVRHGATYEVTTFRREGAYRDARHPDEVAFVDDVACDLRRRDFTVNAFAWHEREGEITYPAGAEDDLAGRTLRCVGEARERFSEDALRILRGLRFSSTLDFRMDAPTRAAAHELRDTLAGLPGERVLPEMDKLMCGPAAARVMDAEADVVFALMPQLKDMRGFDQRNPYHDRDVWGHALAVLEQSEATPLQRWCALLHDAGKIRTLELGEDGVGHFPDHPAASEAMAREIMDRMRAPKAFTKRLARMVLHHDDQIEPTREAVARFIGRKFGGDTELFHELCRFKQADEAGKSERCRLEGTRARQARELDGICTELEREHLPYSRRELALDGHAVVAELGPELGLGPGRWVGLLQQQLLELVWAGRVENDPAQLLEAARDLVRY